MSGTRSGGRKAAAKNLTRDPDFYKKIGSKGGKNSSTGGFARQPGETAAEHYARVASAGSKGGKVSKRTY